MTDLSERAPDQILLLAPDLLGESLALQINSAEPKLEVFLKPEQLTKHPCLVIWFIESIQTPISIQIEQRRLQEHWQPAQVLLLLPGHQSLKPADLLQFDCPGLLQDPDLKTLLLAIKTLRGGGRVVRLKERFQENYIPKPSPIGLGQWLLVSGIQQIDFDLKIIDQILTSSTNSQLQDIFLQGRKRELKFAKSFLYTLWGSTSTSIREAQYKASRQRNVFGSLSSENEGTTITLKKRDAKGVWTAIRGRLEEYVSNELTNSTAIDLAIDALNESRQRELLLALLRQLDEVIQKLRDSKNIQHGYTETWSALQPELRQQALRQMIGSYIRLPLRGTLTPVVDHLITQSDPTLSDDELPDPTHMLDPLLLDRPLLVGGQLLAADDPRALIQLELLFSNWIIRTSELVGAEVIEACGSWPELRRYLLKSHLISTRELERLRNHLNSQNRWKNLIERPIQLYESKRLLYKLRNGSIEPVLVMEPRDDELRQLGWWQQQVALLVEARDALAPQIQSLIKRIGDLMVIILTQVVGRAIGLIGRGIAQGMGRSLGKG